MDIKTKFNIGQEVYIVGYRTKGIKGDKCAACSGKGKIKLKDNRLYTCPCCFGYKHESITVRDNYPIKFKIGLILIKKDGIISYVYCYDDDEFSEKDMYATYEECLAACEKLNKV